MSMLFHFTNLRSRDEFVASKNERIQPEKKAKTVVASLEPGPRISFQPFHAKVWSCSLKFVFPFPLFVTADVMLNSTMNADTPSLFEPGNQLF